MKIRTRSYIAVVVSSTGLWYPLHSYMIITSNVQAHMTGIHGRGESLSLEQPRSRSDIMVAQTGAVIGAMICYFVGVTGDATLRCHTRVA